GGEGTQEGARSCGRHGGVLSGRVIRAVRTVRPASPGPARAVVAGSGTAAEPEEGAARRLRPRWRGRSGAGVRGARGRGNGPRGAGAAGPRRRAAGSGPATDGGGRAAEVDVAARREQEQQPGRVIERGPARPPPDSLFSYLVARDRGRRRRPSQEGVHIVDDAISRTGTCEGAAGAVRGSPRRRARRSTPIRSPAVRLPRRRPA